jgi:hypothetical protein
VALKSKEVKRALLSAILDRGVALVSGKVLGVRIRDALGFHATVVLVHRPGLSRTWTDKRPQQEHRRCGKKP